MPTAVELVYDNYNALTIGFGPSERASEVIVSLALYPRWVSLFFLQGAKLSDPEELLGGSGKQVRHIVLGQSNDLDKPAVEALLAEAIRGARHPTRMRRREVYPEIAEGSLLRGTRRESSSMWGYVSIDPHAPKSANNRK